MILETIPEIQKLTTEEKLILSDELWRAVVGESSYETDPVVAEKLNERFREYEADPAKAISADEMKRRFKRTKDQGRNA